MAMQSGFIKRIRDIMRMDAGINGDAQRIEQMVWMLFLKVYDAKEDDWELSEDDYESIIPEELRWRKWAKADEQRSRYDWGQAAQLRQQHSVPGAEGQRCKRR